MENDHPVVHKKERTRAVDCEVFHLLDGHRSPFGEVILVVGYVRAVFSDSAPVGLKMVGAFGENERATAVDFEFFKCFANDGCGILVAVGFKAKIGNRQGACREIDNCRDEGEEGYGVFHDSLCDVFFEG